jgi:hypothetical protein
MKKLVLLAFLLPLFLFACVSADDSFLVQKLDDEAKSQALTAAGIDEYQLYVVRNKDYGQLERIKDYFATALRFDPTNVQAQNYLAQLGNFKSQQVKASYTAATKLIAKPKRSDDDTYQAAVYLQTAATLDPANTDVQKAITGLQADTAKLVDGYLGKAKASLATVTEKSAVTAREKAYTDAYGFVNKALDVDPKNAGAQGQARTIKAELTKMVAARVGTIQQLVGAAKYADARTQLTGLADLNRRGGNEFDADVRAQTYAVNFAWAKAAYGQKDYTTAESRVDAALAVNRTGEASTLKKTLVDLRQKTTAGASFETALADVDKAIAGGDLVGAHRKLDALANATTDQAKLSQLDTRDQQIIDALKPLYDDGVQAYRDEDFKTAIDKLTVVVSVKVDYEQASDYLDKAKAKQKLLDKS